MLAFIQRATCGGKITMPINLNPPLQWSNVVQWECFPSSETGEVVSWRFTVHLNKDPKRRARGTMELLRLRHDHVLDWSSQSPDQNPLHSLHWGEALDQCFSTFFSFWLQDHTSPPNFNCHNKRHKPTVAPWRICGSLRENVTEQDIYSTKL